MGSKLSSTNKFRLFKLNDYWGIITNNRILYDADFKAKEHANAILDAHSKGAETFEEALLKIDPDVAGEILRS